MCSCLLYFCSEAKIGTKSWLKERNETSKGSTFHHVNMTSCCQPILTIHFYVTISSTLEHKQDNKRKTELGTNTGVEAALLKDLFKHLLLFQTAWWYKTHRFDAFSLYILLDKKVALILSAQCLITHTMLTLKTGRSEKFSYGYFKIHFFESRDQGFLHSFITDKDRRRNSSENSRKSTGKMP